MIRTQLVRLPYGQRYLEVKIPQANRVSILTPKGGRPIADPRHYARVKISNYFAENRRRFSRYKGRRVCIVISDNTRFAFNDIIIPILLKELADVGVRKNNITILVANGLHAPMNYHDLAANLGKSIVDNFKVQNHDPDGVLVALGTTSRGTPVFFNKNFMDADLKIATGVVTPHFHAGFGGGFKSILPGVSGRTTILKNHSFDSIAHDRARYGLLDGNPIYEDIAEGGLKSGLNLIVNVAVDSEKNMTHLFIGEPETTHRKAAEKVTNDMKVKFRELFDIVVTTNGGYPLDRNLYQCVKGVAVGELIVKRGGTIILAGECRDGVGHRTFQKYMSHSRDAQEVLSKVKADEPVEDQDNIQILARILTRTKVVVVTKGVEPETIRAMKMEYAQTVEDALRSCRWPERNGLSMAIVPGGPYVLPKAHHLDIE